MPQLISLLTAAAMLVHMLAGCCWHHAHASQVTEVQATDCCSHCGAEVPASREPADESQHEPCEEGRCVIILSVSTAITAPWDLPGPASLHDFSLPMAIKLSAVPTSPADLIEPAEPPLTPVALHQLLRI